MDRIINLRTECEEKWEAAKAFHKNRCDGDGRLSVEDGEAFDKMKDESLLRKSGRQYRRDFSPIMLQRHSKCGMRLTRF